MASVTRFLENRLKLMVNQDKGKVALTDRITFLIPLKKPDSRGVASIFQSMRLTL